MPARSRRQPRSASTLLRRPPLQFPGRQLFTAPASWRAGRVQNNLALVLATCPTDSLRNGFKAVELAKKSNQLSGGS
jgi:hypothetical protein